MKVVIFILSLFLAGTVNAEVLFEDNFDGHSDWSPTQLEHDQGDSTSSTDGDHDTRCTGCPDGTAIYAGFRVASSAWNDYVGNTLELNSDNYRGSNGKGLTYWHEPIDSNLCDNGTYWCSDQIMVIRLETPQDEIYVRHYIKFQSDWVFDTDPPAAMKMNHFTHYVSDSFWTFFKSGNHWPIMLNDFGIGEGYTDAQITAHLRKQSCYYPNDGYDDWENDGAVVANDFVRLGANDDEVSLTCTHSSDCKDWDELLIDGNWHCLEYRLKGNTGEGVHDGIHEMWIDGIKIFSLTHVPYADSGEDASGDNICSDCGGNVIDPPSDFQGWNMIMIGGNMYNRYYSSSSHTEQWYAIDDLVISTTYVGVDYQIGDSTTFNGISGSGVWIQ